MTGTNGTNHPSGNLAFTKFLFVAPAREDEDTLAKLRAAAAVVARAYFNDFETEGARESANQDNVQFLARTCAPGAAIDDPLFVMQISSRYRPRLDESEAEFRRRAGEIAEITALDGATRPPQYTTAEMHAYAYSNARLRISSRQPHNVIIIPISKTAPWWQMSALERTSFFYPHIDADSGQPAHGHAVAAEAGISTIYRRLYYNPDGHGRPGEYDFITYFECADEHLPVFNDVCRRLRDVKLNPEWRFVVEGVEWRGKRVLRW